MTKQELQSQLSNVERAIDCIKEMIAELKAGDRAKWGYLLPHSEVFFGLTTSDAPENTTHKARQHDPYPHRDPPYCRPPAAL